MYDKHSPNTLGSGQYWSIRIWNWEICHQSLLFFGHTGVPVNLMIKYTGLQIISMQDINGAKDYFKILAYWAYDLYQSSCKNLSYIRDHGKYLMLDQRLFQAEVSMEPQKFLKVNGARAYFTDGCFLFPVPYSSMILTSPLCRLPFKGMDIVHGNTGPVNLQRDHRSFLSFKGQGQCLF